MSTPLPSAPSDITPKEPQAGLWASLRQFSAPQKGALIVALLVMSLIWLHNGIKTGYGPGGLYGLLAFTVVIPLACAVAGLLFAGLFGGVTAAARLLLRRRPLWSPRAAREGLYTGLMLAGCGGTTAAWMMTGFSPVIKILPVALVLTLVPVFLGIAIGLVAGRGWRPVATVTLVLALIANVGMGSVLIYRGTYTPGAPGWTPALAVKPVTAGNPGKPGTFAVKTMTLTYGSGTDKRAEFGKQATLTTPTVDITPIRPDYPGWKGAFREFAWGFDYAHVPLNGRVWFPDGAGPFPLILFVHGNHEGMDYSDPGYAYMGEQLATRGFIFVSVDQNFMNGSFISSATDEMGARGYLLLRHIGAFADFNRQQGNPFYGKVDLNNVAVGGHSRGGEAAAVAAMLNKLDSYPGKDLKLGFNYNIKAVLAYAPSDHQLEFGRTATALRDVDYLVIQGGRDTDAWEFMGICQYYRTRFSDGQFHFKGGLWIDNIDHGQMNSSWGRDRPPLAGWLYEEAPLMPDETARQVLNTYVSAFFETTLHGNRAYLPFLQDYRTGAAWLPEAKYAMLYEDSTFEPVANYEEDANPGTISISAGRAVLENVTATEPTPWLREKSWVRETRSAELTWTQGGRYTLQFPETLPGDWKPLSQASLVFALADGTAETTAHAPVDLTVELEDQSGKVARVALSRYGAPLQKPVVPLTRMGLLDGLLGKGAHGPVLETFAIPVADFGFVDASRLKAVRFVFDKAPAGTVFLDDVGFRWNP